MILYPHFDVNEKGHLTIGGADAVELAERFGTPAYIIDENVVRARCREYLTAAAESFGKALEIDSTSPMLQLQRGNALLQIDSTQAAVEYYNKILTKHPHNREARFFRAYAYSLLGQYKEGKLDYIKLISANGEDKEARLGLAVLYQREGNINECLMMLETLIEEYPDDAELYIARCNLEREQGQTELALQDVQKAIELEPHNAAHRITEAELLQQLGRDDAARKSRNAATKISTTRE
jgi:predicted Zn-dependent protease